MPLTDITRWNYSIKSGICCFIYLLHVYVLVFFKWLSRFVLPKISSAGNFSGTEWHFRIIKFAFPITPACYSTGETHAISNYKPFMHTQSVSCINRQYRKYRVHEQKKKFSGSIYSMNSSPLFYKYKSLT